MVVGDGLGILIVDAAGNVVAKIKGGPGRVKQLAPGYSLRRGKAGEAFRPERLSGGDWTYGGHASYAIQSPEQLTGDEGMFGWEDYGGQARYVPGNAQSLSDWKKYGGHAMYKPAPGQTLTGMGVDAEAGGPGLPMSKLDKLAIESSSAASLDGDEGMFGPEGESSDLF